MLQYLKDQYTKSLKKLDAVRAQCIDLSLSQHPQDVFAVAWQLKPFETMVGLWQGRVMEAESQQLVTVEIETDNNGPIYREVLPITDVTYGMEIINA